jgi:hypothetical protein
MPWIGLWKALAIDKLMAMQYKRCVSSSSFSRNRRIREKVIIFAASEIIIMQRITKIHRCGACSSARGEKRQ